MKKTISRKFHYLKKIGEDCQKHLFTICEREGVKNYLIVVCILTLLIFLIIPFAYLSTIWVRPEDSVQLKDYTNHILLYFIVSFFGANFLYFSAETCFFVVRKFNASLDKTRDIRENPSDDR